MERRKWGRTEVHWPVLLFRNEPGVAVESRTQNLSSGGFYCLAATAFAQGELLIGRLKLPAYDPGGQEPERTLECRIRVVRVESGGAEGRFGVACRIEDYRVIQAHAGDYPEVVGK